MSSTTWYLLQEIDTLRHQINNLFDELAHVRIPKITNNFLSCAPKIENAAWEPAIEIKETDSSVILQIQVPGVEAFDLDIHVCQGEVSVSGEYKGQKVDNEASVHYSEFSYGHFRRIIPLPVCVEYKQVKAETHNGILTLNLPISHTQKYDVVQSDLNNVSNNSVPSNH